MQESKRRQETMRFFNMLQERERILATHHYNEQYDKRIPTNILQALEYGFSWSLAPTPNYWEEIYKAIKMWDYTLIIEPMEQQSELDYMISVMQAKKEKKPIMKTCKIESDFLFGYDYDMHETENFDWVRNNYFVKVEPPKKKTEKFTFADADFLVGLQVRLKDVFVGIIGRVAESQIDVGNKTYDISHDAISSKWEYKCPKTEEWKPFEKVIE